MVYTKLSARIGVALAAMALSLVLVAAPAEAAQRFQFRNNGGGGNSAPFNIDQDPCREQGGHPHVDARGRVVCGDAPSPHGNGGGNGGGRRLGPSAFGLQFDGGEN